VNRSEQGRAIAVLVAALVLSLLIHAAFLVGLKNYHEVHADDTHEVQKVTLMTVVHLHTPPPPTPTPPPPTPTPLITPTPPPPSPTPEVTQTPPPVTPKPATPAPQTPTPATPAPVVRAHAAPKAAHLHLNAPKQSTVRSDASSESHADDAPGNQNGTLAGKGATGGDTGTGAGGEGTGDKPAAPAATCPVPNRAPNVDIPFVPESPEGTEGISVTVRVRVSLSAQSTILATSIETSSGNPLLDHAALDASNRTKFHTERVNCVDIPGSYIYRVRFDGG
jgi:TonB family protein